MFRFLRLVPLLPTLDSTLPAYRRMPPPSRLPEMDRDEIERVAPAPVRPRVPSAQRGLAAALPGSLRR
jgi:hypothetical protein